MQKYRHIMFLMVLLSTSVIASGKDLSILLNDTLGIGNYVILNFEENIEFIAKKDSLSPAELTNNDFKELKSIIIDFIKNKIIEAEVEEAKDIHEPESYLFQFLPTVNAKGHKLVWINGIHSSFIDKDQNLKKLIVIADGRNLYFNFWIDLSNNAIMR